MKKVSVKKKAIYLIGSGEHAIFVKAGITPIKSCMMIDKKLDNIIKQHKKEERRKRLHNTLMRIFKKKTHY